MFSDFTLKNAVEKRYSVRSYDREAPDPALLAKIFDYAASLENPFGPGIRLHLIEREAAANGEKMGTYGVIKGAKLFLGVTVADKPYAAEAVGYEFEKLVLYAASLGLGTCWLGGTFNKSAFAGAMEIKEGELFPILSPIGFPAGRKSLTERLMRLGVKADSRLPWQELFFADSFDTPLYETYTGPYRFALEMLRLAPSAVNKQPWRVLVCADAVHFYRKGNYPSLGGIDMQRIDMGIAMCHFDLAVQDLGLPGHFEIKDPSLPSQGLQYIASWIKD